MFFEQWTWVSICGKVGDSWCLYFPLLERGRTARVQGCWEMKEGLYPCTLSPHCYHCQVLGVLGFFTLRP